MAEGTALRIEVESTGVAKSAGGGTPKTFNQLKEEREAAAAKFREDAAKFRETHSAGGTLTAAEERKRAAADRVKRMAEDRQNRDEEWYEKDLARQQREKHRQKIKDELQQSRNEDWYERDIKRQQKQNDMAKRQRETQQKRDEDWYENERRREYWSRPGNIAKGMIDRQRFNRQIQIEHTAQRLGIPANHPVTKSLSRLSVTSGNLAMKFGMLTVGAVAIAGAWTAARNKLMEEADRIRNFSPELKFQNALNKLRDQMTGKQIADKHGGRMAEIEDLQNRRDNAWRIIKTDMAGWFDRMANKIVGPIEEWYTSMLEKMAGTDKVQEKNNETLLRILDISGKQLEEMGIKAQYGNMLGHALQQAQRFVRMMGGEMNEMKHRPGDQMQQIFDEGMVALPRDARPEGFVRMPDWWRAAQ